MLIGWLVVLDIDWLPGCTGSQTCLLVGFGCRIYTLGTVCMRFAQTSQNFDFQKHVKIVGCADFSLYDQYDTL